ncbi:MAG: NAD-dependent epimerase/dehydratase family protein [Opitutaceae bacterium]|nr:NAD-dependent epimerase/dehydratase family protein [Opitutaceae bacterium]
MARALVTGGAGFIGSHVVERLLADGVAVVVFDNFSTGYLRNLAAVAGHANLSVVEGDTLDRGALADAMQGADAVFHLQANADVRGGMHHTRADLEQNTIATWNVCEAARLAGACTLVFASSATVYGEPAVFPTPEDVPLVQTSLYGASKLAGEAMMQAYAEYFGLRSLVFRFVSCIGPRYSHGVVVDFLRKLRADPARLEILGDGAQRKSFLDVRDTVAGVFMALERSTERKAVYNLGHQDSVDVLTVARLVTEELGLAGVRLEPTGGVRGWLGDSPVVQLDTTRIRALGWAPVIPLEVALRETVRDLVRREAEPAN